MELRKSKKDNIYVYKLFYDGLELAIDGNKGDDKLEFSDPNKINRELLYQLKNSDFKFPADFWVNDVKIFHDLNIELFSIDFNVHVEFEFTLRASSILNLMRIHPKSYLNIFKGYIEKSNEFKVIEYSPDLDSDEDYVNDMSGVFLGFRTYKPFVNNILNQLDNLHQSLNKITASVEEDIKGFNWKIEYENNEHLFNQEVLLKLFRKMRFDNVSFNHGTKEFGRDIIFTELNKFGIVNSYGVQVKAGNISGKVNSSIDEIIGQINDSFQMPFISLDSKSERYISILIIAISGYFTENAKSKILNKIPKGLYGSVMFFDKDKILELITKYW